MIYKNIFRVLALLFKKLGDWFGTDRKNSILKHVTKSIHRHRVPVVLQLTQGECGAACLTMILNYHGRKTSVSECRDFCDPGRDGLTAQTIVKVARNFGLRAKAYTVNLKNIKYLQLPAIIHWNFNHYLIVEKFTRGRVEIVDPAVGYRRLTIDEFDIGFTGVALTFEPGVHFKQNSSKGKSLWYKYLKAILLVPRSLRTLLQILAISLLMQVLGLAMPIFTKVLVDNVLPFHITNIMPILGIGIVLLVLSRIVITYLRGALFLYLQSRVDAHMMTGFFEHVLRLPFQFFHKLTTGDLIMRLGSNTMIRQALTNQTISIMLDGPFVLFYLVILLTQSLTFGGIVLVFGLVQVSILFASRTKMQDLMRRDLTASAESQSYLVEALKGIATLKASGTENRAYDHWSNLFFKHLNIILQRGHFSLVLRTAWTGLYALWPLTLLWVGAHFVMNNTMSLGTMLALNALAGSFLGPLSGLVSTGQQLQLVRAYLERINHVIETEPEQNPQEVQKAPHPITKIELKGVSFRYDKNSPLVLKNISVIIEAGQKVALVGRTGAGKSTLAMILLGLYVPEKGEILYNGMPLQKMNYQTLRSQFGVVLQESFLFNSSIRQNIAFNDPGMSLDELKEAARIAVIHDEIMRMPLGYDTIISEGGIGLSGGQRQRLSIARALAHKPSLLLLDEATSHLDAATEAMVDDQLSRLSCTRIVIAHRLSTIKNSDLILVIDNGSITELGTHGKLLAKSSHYAELIQCQLESESPELVLREND
jgi:ABC-type bacteriocin/lantibiotic exporter with double-glycine peptidase domain